MAGESTNGDSFRLSDELNKLKVRALERMDSQASSQGALISPSGASPGATQRGTYRSHRTEPFLIGVAGGTASGKTTVCDQIVQRLNGKQFFDLPLQCFCRTKLLILLFFKPINLKTPIPFIHCRPMCRYVGSGLFLQRSY